MLQKRPLLIVVIVFCLAIAAAEHYVPVFFVRNHYSKHFSQATVFRYRLTSDYTKRAKTIVFDAEVEAFFDGSRWRKTNGGIKLYISKSDSTKLHYGDVIQSNAPMYAIKNMPNGHFDYKRFMKRRRIYHNVFIKQYQKIAEHKYNPIIFAARSINQSLRNRLQHSGLGKQESALAIGMMLSDKRGIDEDIRHNFNTSGLGHILCVSGLHIGIILVIFRRVFGFMVWGNFRRFYVFRLAMIAVAYFIAFIVGFTPSVLRAATMFSFFILADMSGKRYDRLNVLAFTALIFLILNPLVLFDVGFQMSYLSMAGIIVFLPLFEGLFIKEKHPNSLKKLLYNLRLEAEVCISAQLFTLPVAAYHFKRIPTYFLFANIVVVPFVGAALMMILVLLVVADVPFIGDIASFATNIVLKAMIAFTSWIDALPYSSIQ
ncbi:MAG: ComEC family competence protein [Bacteroidales bacterium]|jgi:competence protein ComEC|nr:ComEC family competence protein [Bacteroidales bacterium]